MRGTARMRSCRARSAMRRRRPRSAASSTPAASWCRYTQRPWLKSLQDVVPELKGGKTMDQNGNRKVAIPKWPETSEDVKIPGVRAGRRGSSVCLRAC